MLRKDGTATPKSAYENRNDEDQMDGKYQRGGLRGILFSVSVQVFSLLCCGVVWAENEGRPLISSMSYERPIRIEAGGKAIDLGQHATTRCYDWDSDGDFDLLVGCGDGRLLLFRNNATAKQPQLQEGVPITAGDRDRWGDSYTGLALANLVGDSLLDLIVCHSGNQITIHRNIGTNQVPVFESKGLSFEIQENCQGRFDVADWDQDGLMDLVTGSFSGNLVWYRNEGNGQSPKFGKGESFEDIRLAYNSHPRLLDFNHDGNLDMLLGVNWGTVSLYLNTGTNRAGTESLSEKGSEKVSLTKSRLLQWSDGSDLNLRSENGDDTTPELADFDGDGVLDLISGGKNGRIFLMRGIGYSSRLQVFEELLSRHADNLGTVLKDDAVTRDTLFGALHSLQADLESGLIPEASREQLFQHLSALAKRYPTLLGRSTFDLESSPHLPILAGQFWVVVLEALADSVENRQRVADSLDFQSGHRNLLVDFGVLLVDNDVATPEHLEAMHRLMMAMPRAVWDVETITIADWLGPAIKTQKIRSRTGVNIFALPLGRPENSFPSDSPRPGTTDVFMICLAHELAHNMLDTVGRRIRPELYERKFECLAQAAGPHVVYRSPKSRGIDFVETKKNFKTIGAWDGDDTKWDEAWKNYFKDKEQFDRAYTRGNVQFFLDAPQEAFATLANQYFTDSQLMLELCKTRWEAGHRSNINQFLLIADYLSEGGNDLRFYTMRPGGGLQISKASLVRDPLGRIVEVRSKGTTATFDYQDGGLVTGLGWSNEDAGNR